MIVLLFSLSSGIFRVYHQATVCINNGRYGMKMLGINVFESIILASTSADVCFIVLPVSMIMHNEFIP